MHVYILQTMLTLCLLASSRVLIKTMLPRLLPSAPPLVALLPLLSSLQKSNLSRTLIKTTDPRPLPRAAKPASAQSHLSRPPAAPMAGPARVVLIRNAPRRPQQLLLQLHLLLRRNHPDQSVPGAQACNQLEKHAKLLPSVCTMNLWLKLL